MADFSGIRTVAIRGCTSQWPGQAAPLSNCPIEIAGRTLEQVIERLPILATLPKGLYAREASAHAFWSDSKVLDSDARLLAVNTALGDEDYFRPLPVLVHVGFPPELEADLGVLFIENEATYLRAIEHTERLGCAVIWSSGFKASARRIKDPRSVVIHVSAGDADVSEDHVSWISEVLQGVRTPKLAFFGDLDFSGMQILARLRDVFPGLRAWEPAYAHLLRALERNDAHMPAEAGKEKQRDPGITGCSYADSVLLPALRFHKKFVDQERFLFGSMPATEPM